MKSILPGLFISLLLSCCNNKSQSPQKTADSLQQLLGAIRDSIRKYPSEPRLKYNLAIVLQDAGRYAEALKALDSMNISRPDSSDPYIYYNYLFKRSELLELTGDTLNAIATLEKFVSQGELTQAGIRLAHLYAETKNPATVPFCDAMIRNDEAGVAPEPNYFKGLYYFNTADFQKAILEFDQSIQKDYNFMDAHLEKGISYYRLQKYNEAIETLNIALKVSNSFADAYYWKARSQEALGQKEEAKLNYQRAFGLDRSLVEAKEAAERL